MEFVSGLTLESDSSAAAAVLAEQVEARLGGAVDLCLLFFSPHFTPEAAGIAGLLRERLAPGLLLGCSAEGVIGSEEEVEHRAAISIVAARLPEVQARPFHLQPGNWTQALLSEAGFRRALAPPDDPALFIFLADPFSTPVDEILDAFNSYYPGVPVIGGMASGASKPGGNALLLDGALAHSGGVGVALAGSFDVEVIVSQGCRPIGEPLTVGDAQGNVILSLDGQPPLASIEELVGGLSPDERDLLRKSGLFLGRAISEGRERLGRGDYLIRGVIGIDQQRGAIAVGDHIHTGEKVQFHLRDAATAEEDLDMLLALQAFYEAPSGAFLFSCNGRGTRLYPHPNGDVRVIQRALGGVDLGGFFCAGEIGPVGGVNFLHGQTASLALFRPERRVARLQEGEA